MTARLAVVALLLVCLPLGVAGSPSGAAPAAPTAPTAPTAQTAQTAQTAPTGPRPAGAAGTDPVGVWPLVPRPAVLRTFDPPDAPWGAGHRGVDLLGRPGQWVRAALAGRVRFAGMLAGRGVVVVDHGGTRTTYEPVEATVALGTAVAAGDRIGRLAAVGSHCPPRACLHWGWIDGADTYLDPLRLVGAGPVRLLPLWRDQPTGAGGAPPVARWRPPPLPYAGWRPLLTLLGRISPLTAAAP